MGGYKDSCWLALPLNPSRLTLNRSQQSVTINITISHNIFKISMIILLDLSQLRRQVSSEVAKVIKAICWLTRLQSKGHAPNYA